MYDPNVSYLRFEKAYNYIGEYIRKKMVDDISEDELKELYTVLIANEDMRAVMLETETELLKRLVEEEEKKNERFK